MIETGVIKALDDMVSYEDVTDGFRALAKMGLMECAFEAVILRHPEHFSAKTVAHAKARLGNMLFKV